MFPKESYPLAKKGYTEYHIPHYDIWRHMGDNTLCVAA